MSPLFNPGAAPSIGGAITGGTAGSVLFVLAPGVFAQDNGEFFYDDATNQFRLPATAASATTTPSLRIGDVQTIYNGAKGLFTVGKNLTNPIAASASTGYFIMGSDATFTQTANASAGGKYIGAMDMTYTVSGVGNFAGLIGNIIQPIYSGSGTLSDGIYAFNALPAQSSGTAGVLSAAYFQCFQFGGTTTNITTAYFYEPEVDGTATNVYGVNVYKHEGGSGDNAQVFLHDQTAAANKYTIYATSVAKSHFAGPVGLGLTTASEALHFGEAKNIAVGTTTGTKIGTATTQKLGFYNATPVVRQTDGAALTNSVTSGGTTDTIANYTDLVIYANDAAAIRNDIYQLARKVKIVGDALRAYGLLS